LVVARPGLARLNWNAFTPVAPGITTQPVSQSVTNVNDPIGPTVTFTVTASGTNHSPISGSYNGRRSVMVSADDPPVIPALNPPLSGISHVTRATPGSIPASSAMLPAKQPA